MKSITTKYHGPTNTRGSRIIARAEGGNSVSMPYDHALDSEGNHREAARALCIKKKWYGRLAYGGAVDGRGYVFVFVNDSNLMDVR